MVEEQYWNRRCKTPGCFGLARPLSDYCNPCHNKRKEEFKILHHISKTSTGIIKEITLRDKGYLELKKEFLP